MFKYLAVTFYVVVSFVFLKAQLGRPFFIKSGSAGFHWRFNFDISWWQGQEYLIAIFYGFSWVMVLLAGWWLTGGQPNTSMVVIVLIVACTSSLVLYARHLKFVEMVKVNFWWLAGIAGVVTYYLSLFSSGQAEYFITSTFKVEASLFPLANKILASLILIYWWLFAFVLVFAVLMFYVVVLANKEKTYSLRNRDKSKIGAKCYVVLRPLPAILLGLYMTILFLVVIFVLGVENSKKILQRAMVFSSFHIHPKDCSVSGFSDSAWVALLGGSRAFVAEPTEDGYRFEEINCVIKTNLEMKKVVMKSLK